MRFSFSAVSAVMGGSPPPSSASRLYALPVSIAPEVAQESDLDVSAATDTSSTNASPVRTHENGSAMLESGVPGSFFDHLSTVIPSGPEKKVEPLPAGFLQPPYTLPFTVNVELEPVPASVSGPPVSPPAVDADHAAAVGPEISPTAPVSAMAVTSASTPVFPRLCLMPQLNTTDGTSTPFTNWLRAKKMFGWLFVASSSVSTASTFTFTSAKSIDSFIGGANMVLAVSVDSFNDGAQDVSSAGNEFFDSFNEGTQAGSFDSFNEGAKEDMDFDKFISMSMDFDESTSMSMPSGDVIDCSTLGEMWESDHKSIEGSDLFLVKEDCDRGVIKTADEVAKAIDAFEVPGTPSINEQFNAVADKICGNALNETDEGFEDIQAACRIHPRNDEHVVDALARFVAMRSPEHDDTVLDETCISIQENRTKIEAGLLVLASRSDEQRRRLDDSSEHPVTAFEIGSDTLSFLDCYCDTHNPGNAGCTKKALLFVEAVTKSVTEKATTIGENPADVWQKAHSSLSKHTSHFRKSGLLHPESSDVHSSVERAMNELQEGACAPPGIQHNGITNGYSVCLYAGPYFECSVSWDPSSALCLTAECGGGTGAKLTAEISYCFGDNTLTLQLMMCVDVVSDVLNVIGQHVPPFEKIMNDLFNIYSGCLRIAYAKYDIGKARFEASLYIERWLPFPFSFVKMSAGAKAWMRFKEDGCAYTDDATWFTKELNAYNRPSGFLWGSSTLSNSKLSPVFNDHKKNGCLIKSGPWSEFELSFRVGISYLIGTEYIFQESVRYTSTTNDVFHNGYRVEALDRSHWNAPDGYYFKMDRIRWERYFGSFNNGITVKQCRYNKVIWQGKIQFWSNKSEARKYPNGKAGDWQVYDTLVKTGDSCTKEVSKRCTGADPDNTWACCTSANPCDIGQGDCDHHSDCRGDLKCGSDNCLSTFGWGTAGHDCCYEKRCTGADPANTDSCCTTKNPCGIGQGDCDNHSQCKAGLKCGTDNCRSKFQWGPAAHDCCYFDLFENE